MINTMKKNILYLFALGFLPALFCSCEQTLMDYEGLEGVYFAVQWGDSWGGLATWPYQPYSNVEFVKIPGNTYTCNLTVMATGPVKDYDRKFKVAVVPDSTNAVEGVHYNALPAECILPAGSVSTQLPVELLRAADMQEKEITLGITLVATEDLALAFPSFDAVDGYATGPVVPNFDASIHVLRMSDYIAEPPVWTGSIQEGGRESGLWGAFSMKKLNLMCERFNLSYSDFLSTSTMPSPLQTLIARTLSRELEELYAAGTPVLEDDGRLMYLGYCSWTSYVGVPWVPEN